MNVIVIVPTYNAGEQWIKWIESYQQQSLKPNQVIVIDSCSQDRTVELALQAGFIVHQIPQSDFDHGSTRNLAVNLIREKNDFLVFLTQDSLLAEPNSLSNLLKPFKDPYVAAVCGRQLPHIDANPLATHARLFNYPAQTIIKTENDIKQLGIKTAFMSNSFAAYRRSVFEELGGFPQNTILAEDMYLAAKMILAGYKVVYCAEAVAYHSHNYTLLQELRRYFDTGVFQQKEQWIQDSFGKAGNEGKKFVLSELKFLLSHAPLWIPRACLSTLCKFLGFKLGMQWFRLPQKLINILSMHKSYWKNNNVK